MKPNHLARTLPLLAPLALLSGCVGYNTTLFMTKSNAGLDLDTKPPTAEINISRREGVVAPGFEGGKTPPVLASFGSKIGSGAGVRRFFFGVDQTFAGGNAALTIAKLYNTDAVPIDGPDSDQRFDSSFPISKVPAANQSRAGKIRRFLFGLHEPGEVKPFLFGTDTQLGVKVGWTGIGGPFPETLKIGFNRKEVAIAPVTLIKDESANNRVQMPSFLATVESNVQGSDGVELAWMQYFATGKAADHLARQPAVRAATLKRADPKAASIKVEDVFLKDSYGDCLRAFWKPDGTNVNTTNAALITAWMQTNNLNTATLPITMFLRGSNYKDLRKKAATDLQIDCAN